MVSSTFETCFGEAGKWLIDYPTSRINYPASKSDFFVFNVNFFG